MHNMLGRSCTRALAGRVRSSPILTASSIIRCWNRWGSEKLPLTTEELTRAGLWAPRHMRLSFNVLWICHFP
jgi:hypothetical protein